MNPYFCGLRPLVALCSLFASLSVWAAEDNAALLRQGEYVARAADCAACHRTVEKGGPALAGGYAIDSPMGKIIASNITPSKTHGIGDYTEQQLADAGNVEHRLGHDGAADQHGEGQPDHGQDRKESVAQGMLENNDPPLQPLGFRRPDIVLIQYFQ